MDQDGTIRAGVVRALIRRSGLSTKELYEEVSSQSSPRIVMSLDEFFLKLEALVKDKTILLVILPSDPKKYRFELILPPGRAS